jgi:hypothetical protein
VCSFYLLNLVVFKVHGDSYLLVIFVEELLISFSFWGYTILINSVTYYCLEVYEKIYTV